MGILDFFKFKGKSRKEYSASSVEHVEASQFGGSRTSVSPFRSGDVVPKKARRELGIDPKQLKNASLSRLVDILADAHPDFSFAVWNFLRLGNSGYTFKVVDPETEEVNEEAEILVKKFIRQLDLPNINQFEISRSFDKVIDQLLLSTALRGANAVELVLAPSLTGVAFIAPIDPETVEFRFESDRYVPYQDNGAVSLDIPTFIYEGLDAMVDNPNGRSPLISAVQTIMLQIHLLQDIEAVVHNQGYPRFDITVLEEVLLKRMPANIRNNEEKKQEWLQGQLNSIISMYNELDPDDTFVHFDSIQVGMAGGAQGTKALIDPEKLMTVIDNLLITGLKTFSTILGRRSTGNTESFAKLETKLYLRGVASMQKAVANTLSKALTLMLNLEGIQGIVEFNFNPLEVRTDLEQEQMKQIKYINLITARQQGWITNDQASIQAVGHKAVSEPLTEETPKNKEGDTPKGTTDTNPDAGGGGSEGDRDS